MNKNILKLASIGAKKERRIIGLMSGTSLDGLDIAVCLISGAGFETKITVEHFETIQFDTNFKAVLKKTCFKETISLRDLTLLNKNIATHHAAAVNTLLKKYEIDAGDVDLIASHGQTIYHAPLHLHRRSAIGHATLQLGDGDHIAVKTGIITISDFRQKNIAGAGEGAPLAAYGDFLLFGERNENVLLLNIGGIANFTYLPQNGKPVSSDIGPGNTLMDGWTKRHFPEKHFDKNAGLALKGKINESLLNALKADSFFNGAFPKTTGQELFSDAFLEKAIKASDAENISVEDVMATLNKFTADIICTVLNETTQQASFRLYISGGGIHNPLLMQHLIKGLGSATIHDTAEKNIPADAKEAVLFALLANECVAGDPATFSGISDHLPAVSMGKISLPH